MFGDFELLNKWALNSMLSGHLCSLCYEHRGWFDPGLLERGCKDLIRLHSIGRHGNCTGPEMV